MSFLIVVVFIVILRNSMQGFGDYKLFEPTAASALSPAKRPTTTISAALNKSCKMLEHINGIAKSSIFLNTEPLHISISYFFFKTFTSSAFLASTKNEEIIYWGSMYLRVDMSF